MTFASQQAHTVVLPKAIALFLRHYWYWHRGTVGTRVRQQLNWDEMDRGTRRFGKDDDVLINFIHSSILINLPEKLNR